MRFQPVGEGKAKKKKKLRGYQCQLAGTVFVFFSLLLLFVLFVLCAFVDLFGEPSKQKKKKAEDHVSLGSKKKKNAATTNKNKEKKKAEQQEKREVESNDITTLHT